MGQIVNRLDFWLSLVVAGVSAVAILNRRAPDLMDRIEAGWARLTHPAPSHVSSVARPVIMSRHEQPDPLLATTLLFLLYARARTTELTTEPNRTATPNYQPYTDQEQAVIKKLLHKGVSASDMIVLTGGTKALRLAEIRTIKAALDAERIPAPLNPDPSMTVPPIEPVATALAAADADR